MTKKKLEDHVTYKELLGSHPLPAESFYIGQSLEGPLTKRLDQLPHMLIAGATGGGKSVFFKQVLMGLLESSPHIAMCLLDLKAGLEMQDFSGPPNVTIATDVKTALNKLIAIEKEMYRRFEFMRERGLKLIVPAFHKMDRIVVAVDESSVLFQMLPRTDANYESTMKARAVLDNLAKLARAAAIHVVLATQKLEKSVIPTTVTENIAARMAFKANTFQGSVLVTGNRDAFDLPETKGRGIWVFGSKHTLIQAPYISDVEILERCKTLTQEYKKEKRKMFNEQIFELKVDSKEASKMRVEKEKGEENNAKAADNSPANVA